MKSIKRSVKFSWERYSCNYFNAINEQDAQASIKAGVHLDKLTEERSKRLENKKSIRRIRN